MPSICFDQLLVILRKRTIHETTTIITNYSFPEKRGYPEVQCGPSYDKWMMAIDPANIASVMVFDLAINTSIYLRCSEKTRRSSTHWIKLHRC